LPPLFDSNRANGLRRATSITTDEIPEAFEKQNINNRAMTPLNFDKAKGATMAPDTLLIKLPMGTGKTKALVNYLNSDQVPKDTRVIIISFRKSFSSELHKNIGPDYQTVDVIINHNKVIVQYKSACRLKVHDLDKTILILDEAKSILTQTESLQANDGDNVFSCWINFDDLIKNLAKVIAMDADTGFCTYDLLASSCKHVHMINNLWRPSPEKAPIDMYYDKPETFMATIAAATTKAKTALFVVVRTSRTQGQRSSTNIALLPVPEAVAFNIDNDHYMELSAKPFLELEEKLKLKKYNLATHYGVDPTEITPKFVKTFDREKPRTIWYNNVKALDLDMKLHDAIVDWSTKSAGEIMNSIDLKHQSLNIIICLLAMDGLNEVMPQTLSSL